MLRCPDVFMGKYEFVLYLSYVVVSVFRDASVAITAGGDHKAKVFCLQRPDR